MIQSAQKALESGKFNEALEISRQVYDSEPQNLDALEGLARSCVKLKKYEEAKKYCHLALNINGSLIWPHCVLSYINVRLDQVEGGKSEALLALQLGPNEWEPNYIWGYLLITKENNDKTALSFLEKAASINPDNWYVYHALQFAYWKKRDLPKFYSALKQMNRLRLSGYSTARILVEEHAILYGVSSFLLHYLLVYFSITLKISAFLLLPALIDIFWIAIGVSQFFGSIAGRRRYLLGVLAIIVGIFQAHAVVWAFNYLR
jgi:tetratricopeptide (TPR) repeat protein